MGYCLREDGLHQLFEMWNRDYVVYGPKCMAGEGMYSDTDVVRYGRLKRFEELEWETKSAYSFKEAILPITQILFYFTEGEVKEAEPERKKPALLFMRSCDIHALKRLDAVYLENHFGDSYYARLRKGLRLVLLGCSKSCDNGFCVSMGTNQTEEYDAAMNIKMVDGQVRAEITGTMDGLEGLLDGLGADRTEAGPDFVSENHVKVRIPEECGPEHVKAGLWKDYDSRCIGCGRCNFACPTCTALPCRIYSTRTTKGRESGAGYMLPAWWMATRMWREEAVTGIPKESACALRSCTRYLILRNSSDTRCAWAAAGVTTSVRNISHFQPA